MLILLAGFALLRWRMARQFSPEEKPTAIPYDPYDPLRFAKMVRLWRRVAAVWLGLFTVMLASYVGSCAEVDAATAVVTECTERLQGAPLQACLAVAHEVAMDASGQAAALCVWVWVIGVL